MTTRLRGTGTIEKVRGGYRPRLPGKGARLDVCPTAEEATRLLDAAVFCRGELPVDPDAITLQRIWEKLVPVRRAQGVRGLATEESRWHVHVEGTELARLPVDRVKPSHVRAWLEALAKKPAAGGFKHRKTRKRIISRTTVANTLQLVRIACRRAVELEYIEASPAEDVKLPRAKGRTHEPWTYLTVEEQRALVESVPGGDRHLVAFALATGLRQGEQWSLKICDVDLVAGVVTVRYGSDGLPMKSGKIRRVHLFPAAIEAVRAWLPELAKQPNPQRLLWPLPGGGRRARGAPSAWDSWLSLAGLEDPKARHDARRVRWHDLRHTCASSLVAGWWGRRWTLEEVRDHLGHSSVTVTERYAHLAGSVLAAAARGTTLAPRSPRNEAKGRAERRGRTGSHLRDLNSRPTVYEGVPSSCASRGLDDVRGAIVGRARRGLEAIAAGGPGAYREAIDALEAIAVLAARGTALEALTW